MKALLAGLLGIACAWNTAAAKPKDLDQQPAATAIPALTQQLMNALPGDPAVWQRLLSDRAVYVGEDGAVLDKKGLLEGFGPFPEGISGAIEVKQLRLFELGDLAIFVFDAHEKQTFYDQHLVVDYRATNTWRREGGRWRLIAAQNLTLAKDPPPLPIDASRLADFVGTYDVAGKRRFRVERKGDGLVGGREGRDLITLIPVGDNVFTAAGNNLGTLLIFVRGKNGAVERMVERRKFSDLDWLKVADAPPSK